MIDKIYAVEMAPYYIKSFKPLLYTTNFKEARVYSTIGPAKAGRTRIINDVLQCPLAKKVFYVGFPRIVEFEIYRKRIIHLGE